MEPFLGALLFLSAGFLAAGFFSPLHEVTFS